MSKGFESLQHVVAARTKALREAKGLSQEALALEADVDRTYVSQLERGVANPSLRVLHQIATILGVSVSRLTEDSR